MWRHVLAVLLAGAFGSSMAMLILAALVGGAEASGGMGHLMAVAIISTFFSVPGAAMLLGLAAILTDRGWSNRRRNILVLTVGAGAGFGSLGLISGWDGQWSATGGLFALMTATMLLIILEHLWPRTPRLSRSAATIPALGGATLLALVTLSMMPI